MLAGPATAQAATLSVSPVKPCYRTGETIGMTGTGFTPDGEVSLAADGEEFATTPADSSGSFTGGLQVASATERVKTYSATDQSNTANTASVPLRISPFDVNVAPQSGPPGRRLRIVARGFTTGRRLWVHVVRGRRRANMRVGRLRGPCRRLRVRKRIFPRGATPGRYIVQFDTRRRYSPDTRVRVRFRVTVVRTFGAQASTPSWTPIG
jgi:hypothetical protein